MVVNPKMDGSSHGWGLGSQVHGIVGKGHPLAMMQTSSLMEVGYGIYRCAFGRLADYRNIWKMT